MRIAVIGASRGIGFELVKLALSEGHKVTALARDPAKLKIFEPKIKIIKGDIRNVNSVNEVLKGQEAVCLCVGIAPTLRPVDVFSKGTANVLAAIKSSPAMKLIAITGIGAGDSKGHGGFLYDKLILPLFLNTIYQDKDRQEALIKASDTQWLIVRPGFLTNGPRTGQYQIIDSLTKVKAGKISRVDVADFILKELITPTHFRKTPLLSYE